MSALTTAQKNFVRNIDIEGEPCSDLRRPTFRYSPEQSLWSACLYEAVLTYLGLGSGASNKERQEARAWFAESFDATTPPPAV